MKVLFFDSTRELELITDKNSSTEVVCYTDAKGEQKYDVMFIHYRNKGDDKYKDLKIEDNFSDTWYIFHSLGNDDSMIFDGKYVGDISFSTIEKNFDKFIQIIDGKSSIKKEDFYVLYGFNPEFEEQISQRKQTSLEKIQQRFNKQIQTSKFTNPSNVPNLKKLIIWDEEAKAMLNGFSQTDDIVIKTEKEWEQANFDFKSIKVIIILVELKWKNKYLQDFYGVTIAQKLRRDYKCRLPILFVSSLFPREIIQKDKQQREIIGAIGHGFIPLQDFSLSKVHKVFKEIKTLNDNQYDYILKNHCDIKGIIGSKLHNIKNEVRALRKKNKTDDEIIEFINEQLSVLATLTSGFTSVSGEIVRLKIKENEANKKQEKIKQFIEVHDSMVTRFFPGEEVGGTSNISKKPWEILWLEDEIIDENILSKLNPQGKNNPNVKINHAKSFDEAKKIIEEDKYNKITVVIADFRLYKNDDDAISIYGRNHKEQEKQGYDFLLWLAGQNRFNKLVALSGLSRSFLSEFFKNQNVNIKIYSKNDIVSNGVNIFVDDIIEYGDEINEVIMNRPKEKGWNCLLPFYAHYRNILKNKDVIEDEISEKARLVISQVKYILSSFDDELKIISNITTYQNITADFDRNSKNPNNEKDFEQFKNKLIARRIALWLYYCEGLGREHIARILKKGRIEGKKITQTNVSNLFRNIGLALDDFPFSILIEEKKWFKQYMGINIYTLEDVLTQIGTHYEEWINKYFSDKNQLPDSCKGYFVNSKVVIHTNKEGMQLVKCIYNGLKNDRIKTKLFLDSTDNLIEHIAADRYCVGYVEKIRDFIHKLETRIVTDEYKGK